MRKSNKVYVKAISQGGDIAYYGSLSACCREYGLRYEKLLTQLIETGGLAPDGKTFFDYPTETEERLIEANKIHLIDR